ncbi:AAA family ATPase [Emticicia sp. SJ17W-69]|uniref:AAA family ATPase n=1 Tax=Emticicia sp. SJ17W-69 TaxID=3421657 RepID=UPI003EC098CE
MYISKITVQNYRNFSSLELDLQSFTLIIGENNVGKTNLLNAIGLILSPDISFFQKRVLETDDFHYQTVLNFKKQVVAESDFSKLIFPEIRVDLVFEKMSHDQKAVMNDCFINDGMVKIGEKAQVTYLSSISQKSDLEKKWFSEIKRNLSSLSIIVTETLEQFEQRQIQSISFPIEYYRYILFGGNNETQKVDFSWLSFLKMELLDALRDAKSQLLAGGRNTLLFSILNTRTTEQTTTSKKDIDSIKEKLAELNQIISKETSVFTDIKKDIEKFLKQISEEDENGLINFQFSGVEESEILKKLSLIYGSEPISIERNGLGRNNLLYISLLLSQLVKNADKKKVYFRLIGIEEPEAHLHPTLQVHLSRNTKEVNEERQVIITSHSTHITSQLDLDNTIVLYKDSGNIKPHYLLKSIPKDSKKYLQKYLDATKSIMFFTRKIILVEGISEQLVIPEFFKIHTKETLEKKNITIVNVQGVAMKHFLEVIKAGYFIKCLVFTDSDDNTRADNLKERYKDCSVIKIEKTSTYTYETDLISSNLREDGKDILLEALIRTRRINGEKLKNSLGSNPIDSDNFFNEIYLKEPDSSGKMTLKHNHKADFAVNLVEVLQDKSFTNKTPKFNIPIYIKDGFDFLIS